MVLDIAKSDLQTGKERWEGWERVIIPESKQIGEGRLGWTSGAPREILQNVGEGGKEKYKQTKRKTMTEKRGGN